MPPADPGTRFDLGTRLGRPFWVSPAATGLAAACAAFQPSSPGEDQVPEFSIGVAPRESATGGSEGAGGGAGAWGALAEAAGAGTAFGAGVEGTLGALGMEGVGPDGGVAAGP